jgi:hypothetical protein
LCVCAHRLPGGGGGGGGGVLGVSVSNNGEKK